jgi:hypothetical protein
LVSFWAGGASCDQDGAATCGTAHVTNMKRRTRAALFLRRVISRPGIHT